MGAIKSDAADPTFRMTSTCLIILGMHRSGTSCLTGTLQQHGVFLGQVFESNPYNKKGNRENHEIMDLNTNLLEFNSGSWDNPPNSITWTARHSQFRDRIISKFLESNCPIWGFKDPRSLFTLDFWLKGLGNIPIKYVGSFRHPLAVAQSLFVRNQIPIEQGLILWDKYNNKLLDIHDKTNFSLVSFDAPSDEYQQSILRILTELKLPSSYVNEQFFDESLRHEIFDDYLVLPDRISNIYNNLNEIYKKQSIIL